MRQPWSFNKSLLVLGNFAGHEKSEEVNLQWCPFWVQIHGLPLGLMTTKIATVLGESIGDVEEVDADGEKMAWGKFLRVRVAINISKPLKRGTRITIEGKGSMLVVFKYEKLPDFCYVCGCLDHQELECDDVIRVKIEGGKAKREYGPWLGTESNEILTRRSEGQYARKSIPSKAIHGRRSNNLGREGGSRWSDGGSGWQTRDNLQRNMGQLWKGKAVITIGGEKEGVSGNDRSGFKSLSPLSPRDSNSNWEEGDSISSADMDRLTNNMKKKELSKKEDTDSKLKTSEPELVEIPISEASTKAQTTKPQLSAKRLSKCGFRKIGRRIPGAVGIPKKRKTSESSSLDGFKKLVEMEEAAFNEGVSFLAGFGNDQPRRAL